MISTSMNVIGAMGIGYLIVAYYDTRAVIRIVNLLLALLLALSAGRLA